MKWVKTVLDGISRHAKPLLAGLAILTLVYAGGFLWFVSAIPEAENTNLTPADAIVVLTGGPERIDSGLTLLAEGNGKRLLISGVYPGVTRDALKDLVSVDNSLFDCCVDVDWRAESTIGNAAETAAWANKHGFNSLIVVTSAYHLPRSLRELAHTMPDITLRGHPVFHDGVHLNDWWHYQGTTRLLISEYSKFLLTLVRLGSIDEA
jgi:uncharacterized SAM-binding protein YcdF (DUF218 family)